MMPVLFIGHGSPMNATQKNSYTKNLENLVSKLKEPKAILVISAHWQSRGTFVTSAKAPEQIYDFYGFPKELYEIEYHPPGNPELAKEIAEFLKHDGALTTEEWGLDHGAWAVLLHIYPKAEIPVLQLSMDINLSPEEKMEIGSKLHELRKKDVLILGSGNIVHNLRLADFHHPEIPPYEWAIEFDRYVREALIERNDLAILEYSKVGEAAKLSVPTTEHFDPIFYVLGSMGRDEKIEFIHEGFEHKSISMRSFMSI
ncbi:4,5-DOPA dioxygenase extradiol [Leptospira perolatii]|uniref:4,5-DOPA dioxygenase extradiol n=1 Tax=Leptospira perolatii TaxID=2023191 RepID=A0A2M9ZSM8_9LEPT|nr:4,5-DOPA dioxygenase extradiol [Leptospira perolatii]PJZ71491.1 4,5-DOPA dioxygenase extradiol [Leptospira perolatii]PJZ75025.1 4,5-DOPA dioxygenase extradiol [Leptospira perolatii]